LRVRLNGANGWKYTQTLTGDKSLSHRSLILASMATSPCHVEGLSQGADVASTAAVLIQLGSQIAKGEDGVVSVSGWGKQGPQEPASVLDCGNSGTTIRLLAGLLSGYSGLFILDGDESLRKRPQGRIVRPISQMGGRLWARQNDTLCPLVVKGGPLKAFQGSPEVASAQVKSSILLAALSSGVEVELEELGFTRDHTENMLRGLGVPLQTDGLKVSLPAGPHNWEGFRFSVPGDPSSAAFLVAAAVLGRGTRVVVENVGLNPTRTGFFSILERMGARLEMTQTGEHMGEPVGRITAESSNLIGTDIEPDEVPPAIDEFPLLAVVATAAEGNTTVRGAAELRVKESDRIRCVVNELSKMGARITEADDGFTVYGPTPLHGAAVECHHDHRLEMSLAVAALTAEGDTNLLNAGWASISFPEFWDFYPGEHETFE
jgi:3-phosphoshikimate 1-carboxyvinyltransferase